MRPTTEKAAPSRPGRSCSRAAPSSRADPRSASGSAAASSRTASCFACACLLAALGAAPASALGGGPPRTPPRVTAAFPVAAGKTVAITAGRLRYAPARKGDCRPRASCKALLRLDGGVTLRAGDFEVRAPRVDLLLDGKGSPALAEARGGVRVRHGRRRGRATRARLRVATRRLTLEGGAALRDPAQGVTIAGKTITLDLASGAVTVADARLTLVRARAGGGR